MQKVKHRQPNQYGKQLQGKILFSYLRYWLGSDPKIISDANECQGLELSFHVTAVQYQDPAMHAAFGDANR